MLKVEEENGVRKGSEEIKRSGGGLKAVNGNGIKWREMKLRVRLNRIWL